MRRECECEREEEVERRERVYEWNVVDNALK